MSIFNTFYPQSDAIRSDHSLTRNTPNYRTNCEKFGFKNATNVLGSLSGVVSGTMVRALVLGRFSEK